MQYPFKPQQWYKILVAVILLSLTSCATFYQRQAVFQQKFESGDIDGALTYLEDNPKMAESKAKVLYFLNKGVVAAMNGKYELSNTNFETADRLIEDYRNNLAWEALILISNPMVKPYMVENFESVMLNYYTCLNYINIGSLEDALVEAKRINIKLNALSDIVKRDNHYKRDAFAHYLMGMVYEAAYDDNNAFIAYRNAYNVYKEDYLPDYQLDPPQQLKQDLMRSAYFNKFWEELDYYEKEFGQQYEHTYSKENGEVLFFWQNGLGPYKTERRLAFTVIPGVGGAVTFENEEDGFIIPFPVNSASSDEQTSLKNLRIVRIVLPKFVERPPVFRGANLKANGQSKPLEIAEPINDIAFKSLRDRITRELAKTLLRVALKQAIAETAKANDKTGLGLAINLLSAITEQADTRNWQTLPHSIFVGRMSLPPGTHIITLETISPEGESQQIQIEVEIERGKTKFINYHSLETIPKY